MVRLVDEDDVPGATGEDFRPAIPTASKVRRRQQHRERLPRVPTGTGQLLVDPGAPGEEPAPLLSWDEKRELLVELFLPLADDRCRHQKQRRRGPAGHEQLSKDQAGLDRLAEPYLVAQQVAAREAVDDSTRDRELVRPRFDTGGDVPDAGPGAETGGSRHELETNLVSLCIGFFAGLLRVNRGRSRDVLDALDEMLRHRLRQTDDGPAPTDVAAPMRLEAVDHILAVPRPHRFVP